MQNILKCCLKSLSLRCFSIFCVCSIGKEMQTKFKKIRKHARIKQNVIYLLWPDWIAMYINLFSCYLKVFSFLLSYAFFKNLHLKHGTGWKSSVLLNFNNEIYQYRLFLWSHWTIFLWNKFFIKQSFYETIFFNSKQKKLPIIFYKFYYLLCLSHHNIKIASESQWKCQGLWWPYIC